MAVAIFAIAFTTIIFIMATLGAVLLAWLALDRAAQSRRVFAAALGGPLTIILPGFAIIFTGQGFVPTEQFFGLALLGAFAFGAIGWPVAHFATQRLDRLTRFNPQVFE